jgi:hypothetical protein
MAGRAPGPEPAEEFALNRATDWHRGPLVFGTFVSHFVSHFTPTLTGLTKCEIKCETKAPASSESECPNLGYDDFVYFNSNSSLVGN